MKFRARFLVAGILCFGGCRTAHNVAVSSYHVVTAPVTLVHHRSDPPPPATAQSDVTEPGHPVAIEHSTTASTSRSSSETRKPTAQTTSKRSVPPGVESTKPQFPMGKPVPGKPGYVFSPSDPSKYVDVTDYAAGSKVKDPYSGKIFLVP